jgi:hypothetical protein
MIARHLARARALCGNLLNAANNFRGKNLLPHLCLRPFRLAEKRLVPPPHENLLRPEKPGKIPFGHRCPNCT